MNYQVKVLLNIFLISSSFRTIVKAELYSALVDLIPLVHTGSEIVKTLEKYLEMEEKRLQKVRWLRKQYEKLYEAAITDVDTFLANPVNAYLIVKRLTTDWKVTVDLIEGSMSKAVIYNITQQELKFPDDEDLTGVAFALMRLQDTYLLETTKLARGEIEGTARSPELTAGDCFELGRQACIHNDDYHTMLWMQEALDRLEEEKFKTINKIVILEHMSYSTYKLGNPRHGLKLTQDIIAIDPANPLAYKRLHFFKEHLKELNGTDTEEIDYALNKPLISPPWYHPYDEYQNYTRLCRGEHLRSPAKESLLHCRYTGNKGYLLLQPAKLEILSLTPRVVVYHDVIRDNDIRIIKELARPKLLRAAVYFSEARILENSNIRVGKSTWLHDDEHPRFAYMSRMIEEITGLSTKHAEPLHVVNYGIGGQFEPHYDISELEEGDPYLVSGIGNRISTWIFYLSDVDAGGTTVFTDIGVQVKPIKGSAVFWHNLKKSGEIDMGTNHAGCPVLAGTKWIANKWLHESDQEFRRPCSLNPLE